MATMRNWDLTVTPSHLFYWIKKRKEYNLTNHDLFEALKTSSHECIARIIRPIIKSIR